MIFLKDEIFAQIVQKKKLTNGLVIVSPVMMQLSSTCHLAKMKTMISAMEALILLTTKMNE